MKASAYFNENYVLASQNMNSLFVMDTEYKPITTIDDKQLKLFD